MKTPYSSLYVCFFVGFVVIVSGYGVSGLNQAIQAKKDNSLTFEQVLSGALAKDIEAIYDDTFSLKIFSTNLWAAVDYLAFNEGKKGLAIGEHGWLFTTEELASPKYAKANIQNNLAFIEAAKRELQRRNIELIVVPIPAKARVYSEYLGRNTPSDTNKTLYYEFTQFLKETKTSATESLRNMHESMIHGPAFFQTDTHWTPLAANTIAISVAKKLKNTQTDLAFIVKNYTTETSTSDTSSSQSDYQGDLLKFLPISPWFDDIYAHNDDFITHRTYETTDASSNTSWLFTETDKPSVVLVGTSYSANPQWNFDGALKQALSTDVINLAEEGNGPLVPMKNFIANQAADFPETKLVVWEIPERFLQVSYPEAYRNSFLSGTQLANHTHLTNQTHSPIQKDLKNKKL